MRPRRFVDCDTTTSYEVAYRDTQDLFGRIYILKQGDTYYTVFNHRDFLCLKQRGMEPVMRSVDCKVYYYN